MILTHLPFNISAITLASVHFQGKTLSDTIYCGLYIPGITEAPPTHLRVTTFWAKWGGGSQIRVARGKKPAQARLGHCQRDQRQSGVVVASAD